MADAVSMFHVSKFYGLTPVSKFLVSCASHVSMASPFLATLFQVSMASPFLVSVKIRRFEDS